MYYKSIGNTRLLKKIYNDLEIKKKKPTNKRQVLPVGDAVFVVIEPVKNIINNYSGKSLIGKCKFPPSRLGKSIDVRLGKYGIGKDRISIKKAKEKFIEVRIASKAQGLDPRIILKNETNKKVINEINPTLLSAVEGWVNNNSQWSKTTKTDYERRIYNQIMNPDKGGFAPDTPIKDFAWSNGGRDKCLSWLEQEQPRAEEQARRNFMVLRNILEWSIDRGWLNPPNSAMNSKNTRSNRKAVSNPFLGWDEIDNFIRDVNAYEEEGKSLLVVNALKLCMLTGLRTNTLVQLEFKEIDEKNNMLVIPEEKMKRKEIHYVPLTEKIREIIKKMKKINKVHSYIFFNHRGGNQPYIQQGSLNNLITKLDGGRYKRKQTAHGFRAFMNTHGIDELGYDKDIIRRCLHHAVGNKVERAYNHAKYFGERREFMEEWSNALVKKGL